MTDVTPILNSIDAGNPQAAERLLPLVYDELRRLAGARMAAERPDHTLDATALVHEAYLRLVGNQSFASKSAFLRAAAEAMRRILVDHARAKNADKRGGDWKRVALADWHETAKSPEQVLALNEALARLATEEPGKAELVTLRYFSGLTMPEAAAVLGVSLPTAERWWAFARSWLYTELMSDSPENLEHE